MPKKKKIPGTLLGFKREFLPMVKDGSKHHSLRGKRKNPPQVGGPAHCYTGLRTKRCELIGRWTITRVREARIEILVGPGDLTQLAVTLDGDRLDTDELIAFAWADGFRFPGIGRRRRGDVLAMRSFWEEENGLAPGSPWVGDLIEWDFAQPCEREVRAA